MPCIHLAVRFLHVGLVKDCDRELTGPGFYDHA